MQIHKILSFMQELICGRVAISFEKGLPSATMLKGQTKEQISDPDQLAGHNLNCGFEIPN